ncbi:DUF397 domain-containing protein [Streptomyces sp. NPDC002623]
MIRDLVWVKSSYSDGNDGESCVEVATTPAAIHVRDSKNPEDGPTFQVASAAWAAFIAAAPLNCALFPGATRRGGPQGAAARAVRPAGSRGARAGRRRAWGPAWGRWSPGEPPPCGYCVWRCPHAPPGAAPSGDDAQAAQDVRRV